MFSIGQVFCFKKNDLQLSSVDQIKKKPFITRWNFSKWQSIIVISVLQMLSKLFTAFSKYPGAKCAYRCVV